MTRTRRADLTVQVLEEFVEAGAIGSNADRLGPLWASRYLVNKYPISVTQPKPPKPRAKPGPKPPPAALTKYQRSYAKRKAMKHINNEYRSICGSLEHGDELVEAALESNCDNCRAALLIGPCSQKGCEVREPLNYTPEPMPGRKKRY